MRADHSRLYPNLVEDQVTLEVPEGVNAAIEYTVYNSMGEQVLGRNFGTIEGSLNERINVSALLTGLYTLRLKIGNSVVIKKFIKN